MESIFPSLNLTSNTTSSYYQTAYDVNGYGGMTYYSSDTCDYETYDGCITDYEQSEVKYVVDAWKAAKAPGASEVRLITLDELTTNLGYEQGMVNPSTQGYVPTSSTPNWVYNSNYSYWTMSQYNDSAALVWMVGDGSLYSVDVNRNSSYVVRPVINLNKSAIEN